MKRTVVIVRAWTKDGYHKDIATLCDEQILMTSHGVVDGELQSVIQGTTVGIDPKLLPEMVKFEVIVQRH